MANGSRLTLDITWGFRMSDPNLSQFIDTDRDGLADRLERSIGTNPFAADTDRDGVPDGDEVRFHLNPLDPDSNGLVAASVPMLGVNPRTPNSMTDRPDAVANFAQQIGSFQGTQYAFTVEPEFVAISALDGRSGINGHGLIYQQYAGEVISELRQDDINKFALVQQHLNQLRQPERPLMLESER
jgi:Bacterial TSP3 repeat